MCLEDAKREVIRASLRDAAYRDDALPDDVHGSAPTWLFVDRHYETLTDGNS